MTLTERGIKYGIWWASNPQRALATVGVVWLNTLKGPVGNWSRAMTWGITKGAVRGGIAGLAFTARTTWLRLLVPLALSTPVQTAAIIAAPVVVAGVAAAGVTAVYQKAGLIGPSAPTTSVGGWLGEKYENLQINPVMISMGPVV